MPREDVRFAVAARQDGLRRVRRLTFRIGAAGLACSAAITVAFGHLSGSAAASGSATGDSTSGGSAGGTSGQPGTGQQGGTQQPGGGSLQAPAQNVAPAQGPAQGVSGGLVIAAGVTGPVPGSLGAMPHLGGQVALVVTSSTPLWYITRATGVVALVLLTVGMALGLLTAVRFEGRHWPRFITIGLHRNMSLLALAFTAAHVLTTILDNFVPIDLQDAFVPFISPYRPAVARVRRDRPGPADRADRDQPAAGPARSSDLAAGALDRLPVLAVRRAARPRHRQRHPHPVGAGGHAPVRGGDRGPDRVAARRRLARASGGPRGRRHRAGGRAGRGRRLAGVGTAAARLVAARRAAGPDPRPGRPPGPPGCRTRSRGWALTARAAGSSWTSP